MNHEHAPSWNTPENNQPSHERQPEKTTPAIYVSSLADYVNGYLTGEWIDATQDIDTIREEIQAMLATSKSPAAEEYTIHDFEGFGTLRIGEYEDLDRVVALAEGVAKHGEAFACWVDYTNLDPEDWDKFEDAYLGSYDSEDAYAEHLIEEMNLEKELDDTIPEFYRSYVTIDKKKLLRDLMHGSIWTMDFDGQTLVFNSHI